MLSRFVFRIMPWWLYGLIALGLLPLFVTLSSQHLKLREDVALARDTPPEVQVMREEGRLPGLDAPLGEFHIRATLLGQGYIGEGKDRKAWALIGPPSGLGAVIALLVPMREAADLEEGLIAARIGEEVELSGFLKPAFGDEEQIRFAARLDGVEIPGTLVTAEPRLGNREEALQGKLTSSLIVLGFFAAVTLIVSAVAVMRFGAWRRRVRDKRGRAMRPVAAAKPASARPAAAPWGGAATGKSTARAKVATAVGQAPIAQIRAQPPKPKADDKFANSPISSSKGWFSR